MFNTSYWKFRLFPTVIATALAFNLSVANALVINATTTFDNQPDPGGFFPPFSFGPTSGSFRVVSGGSITSATFSGEVATPSNELTGVLTNIDDGTGFEGVANANFEEFAIGFDSVISVFNDTPSTETVVFRLNYSNMVNADGGDAFAASELTLSQKLVGDIDFTEIHASHLVSDSSIGDFVGGTGTGTFGQSLTDSGDMLFSFMIGSAEQIELKMSWTLVGGEFFGGPADLAEADLNADLTIVPLPGSLVLMISGMLLLPLQRRLWK